MFTICGDSSLEFLGRYDCETVFTNADIVTADESKKELAKDIILQMLADGAKPATAVRNACLSAGIGSRTIDEAKSELKVNSDKNGP